MTDDVMRELESGDLLDEMLPHEDSERRAMGGKPYFIEVDRNGCSKCGEGQTWRVVGPDGMADSVCYDDESDAERCADRLNTAFERGRSALEAENARLKDALERQRQGFMNLLEFRHIAGTDRYGALTREEIEQERAAIDAALGRQA